MSSNPGVQVYTRFAENALQNVIAQMAPLLQDLQDESGNPLEVHMRAAYPQRASRIPPRPAPGASPTPQPLYPQVLVSVRMGRTVFNTGYNRIGLDQTAKTAVYEVEATGSRLILEVEAESDPQRYYLISALRWGLLAEPRINTDGTTVQTAILRGLDEAGVEVTEIEADQFPRPRPDAARPLGLIFRASLTLRATITYTWTQHIITPSGALIQTQGLNPRVAPPAPGTGRVVRLSVPSTPPRPW